MRIPAYGTGAQMRARAFGTGDDRGVTPVAVGTERMEPEYDMEYDRQKNPVIRRRRVVRREGAREQINRREEEHRQGSQKGGQPGALGLRQGQNGEQDMSDQVPAAPPAETGAGE